MRIWDISAPVQVGTPTWPGDTQYEESRTWTLSGDCPVNVSRVVMSTHTGTHADAPLHYTADGAPAGALPLERYWGPCRVVHALDAGARVERRHLEGRLSECPPRLLLRTQRRAAVDTWDSAFTAIAPDALELLADAGVRLVGIDTPSLDPESSKTLDAHGVVARRGLSVLEGLVLDEVPEGDYELVALPVRLETADAAPVRAALRGPLAPRAPATQAPTRDDATALDAADPLAQHRDAFALPPGVVYLDGNSLGPLPRATPERLRRVIEREWGHDLIRSWNAAGWIDLPRRLGDRLAGLVGAAPGEVIVADSTSVNLFKLLAAALALRPERRRVVSERSNFPTDLYVAQGLNALLAQGHVLDASDDPVAALGPDVAVLMLTHVNYRTGAMYDMAKVTAAAHAVGALVLWDLAHSAGAVPVDLRAAGADFAVGCGYKYLNGGPGAPAFAFVAERHLPSLQTPLSGWMGHAAPFDFTPEYTPAAGIERLLCGTPAVLSMSALEVGLDTVLAAPMSALRAKSLALTSLFIECVERRCAGHPLELVTPRDPAQRGSQVCLRHPDAWPVMQAMIARGFIGDFRAPDILRFGFAPLYVGYREVWDAAEALRDILDSAAWRAPEFQRRARVT